MNPGIIGNAISSKQEEFDRLKEDGDFPWSYERAFDYHDLYDHVDEEAEACPSPPNYARWDDTKDRLCKRGKCR